MSAITAPSQVSPAIDQADVILRQACAALPYLSGDAYAAVRDRVHAFTAALDDHARLLGDHMSWSEYDTELYYFGGDPQEAAIQIAEDKVKEGGRAVIRALSEYMPREAREAAMAGQGTAVLVRGQKGEN